MGDRIQTIAKIIFSLAFVALMSTMFLSIMDMGKSTNDQFVKTNQVIEMHELQAFDQTTVTGATVISAIRNYDNLCKVPLSITVITEGENTYGEGGTDPDYTDPSNNDCYINPTSIFDAELVYNENDIITGIQFTIQ